MASWVDEYHEKELLHIPSDVVFATYEAPVSSTKDLPRVATEGTCCFVRDDDAVYQFVAGVWHCIVGT